MQIAFASLILCFGLCGCAVQSSTKPVEYLDDRTAMLGPDLAETTWRYDVDAKRGVARTKSTDGKHSWEVPLAPFLGCIGVAPAGAEVIDLNFGCPAREVTGAQCGSAWRCCN